MHSRTKRDAIPDPSGQFPGPYVPGCGAFAQRRRAGLSTGRTDLFCNTFRPNHAEHLPDEGSLRYEAPVAAIPAPLGVISHYKKIVLFRDVKILEVPINAQGIFALSILWDGHAMPVAPGDSVELLEGDRPSRRVSPVPGTTQVRPWTRGFRTE